MAHEGMVHALQEAQRILKPNGILIDLRPAPKHRRLGVGKGAHWQSVGIMHENFDDDYAANQAVTEILKTGLFRRESRNEFDLDRVMDTMEDFCSWLDDFVQLGSLPSHAWLVKRLEAKLKTVKKKTKIAVRGPLMLSVLRKTGGWNG